MKKGEKITKLIAENPDVPASAWIQNESDFLAAVVEYAQINGWKVRHVVDRPDHALVIGPGFPDLLMVRTPEIVVAELKRQDAPRELPTDQAEWIALFLGCAAFNGCLLVYVWRPADWPTIEEVLG